MAGSAASPAALAGDAASLKALVAAQLNCSETRPSADADIGDCLRGKPLAALLAVRTDHRTPRFLPAFAPFVDGHIIAVDPLTAMQTPGSTPFHTYPLMAGVTTMESYRLVR